jgi:hypothetical protein
LQEFEKNSRKILVVQKKAVLLHPLSGKTKQVTPDIENDSKMAKIATIDFQ